MHGDGESLAGWKFSAEALADGVPASVQPWFAEADVSVFACSHTCLPILRTFGDGDARRAVINNGAAAIRLNNTTAVASAVATTVTSACL